MNTRSLMTLVGIALVHALAIVTMLMALAATPTNACAQFEAMREGQAALEQGLRLQAVRLIREALKDHPELSYMTFQFEPVISDYTIRVPIDQAVPVPSQNEKYLEEIDANLASLERHKAIDTIIELAKNRQIVILNEAHDTPQHRAMAMQLANALAKVGFEYLAMEALYLPNGQPGIVDIRFPRRNTGFYTRDPVFGDFVRQAIKDGYQLVAYEASQEQLNKTDPSDRYSSILVREEAQAENLIEAVLKDRPTAKIFVYVGYSHATEDWRTLDDGRELGWLAARLKRKTGIDPLTIDQVGGCYNVKTGRIDAVYKRLHDQRPFEEPTLVSLPDGSWVTSDQYHDQVDLTLFLPTPTMHEGRPDWLRSAGQRKPVTISNEKYFQSTTTLLQAFLNDEPDDAIPVDQVIIESDEATSTLLLPPGEYRLVAHLDDGTEKDMGLLKVESS